MLHVLRENIFDYGLYFHSDFDPARNSDTGPEPTESPGHWLWWMLSTEPNLAIRDIRFMWWRRGG
jgi:hypothetical protein